MNEKYPRVVTFLAKCVVESFKDYNTCLIIKYLRNDVSTIRSIVRLKGAVINYL